MRLNIVPLLLTVSLALGRSAAGLPPGTPASGSEGGSGSAPPENPQQTQERLNQTFDDWKRQNTQTGHGYRNQELNEIEGILNRINPDSIRQTAQQAFMAAHGIYGQIHALPQPADPDQLNRLVGQARQAILGIPEGAREQIRAEFAEIRAADAKAAAGGGAGSPGGGPGAGGPATQVPGPGGFSGGSNSAADGLLANFYPSDSLFRGNFARSLLEGGDSASSAKEAARAVALDPTNQAAFTTLAKADFQLNDYHGAADAARSALALNSGDIQAMSVLKLVGGRDQPVPTPQFENLALSRPVSSKPADLSLDKRAASVGERFQANRVVEDAAAYRRIGNFKQAIETAGKALQIDSGNVAALYERALAYILAKQLDLALRDIEAALKLDPANERLLVAHANVLNRMKLYERALGSANSALRANPSSADAYFNKAWALSGLKRTSDALGALDSAARLNPRYARIYREALQLPADADLTALFEGSGEASEGEPRPVPGTPSRGMRPWMMGLLFFLGISLVGVGLASRRLRAGKDSSSSRAGRRRRSGSPRVGELAAGEGESEDVGSVVGGSYNMIRRRGEGSLGTVYEAMDRRLERKVAVKKVRGEIVGDRWEKEGFLKEARAAASLHHGNIVELYAVVEEHGEVYLVSHWAEGGTLEGALREGGRLSFRRAREVLRGMSAALEHAHERHLLHRDLKPSNVMVDGEGRVLVGDFGVGWAGKDTLRRLTLGGGGGGWTEAYWGPEAKQGVGRKESDVYSLAAIFYEMVTGRAPFEGSGEALQENKLRGARVAVGELAPEAPAGLEEVIGAALAPDPDLRIRSAAEFCARVEALAAKSASSPAG